MTILHIILGSSSITHIVPQRKLCARAGNDMSHGQVHVHLVREEHVLDSPQFLQALGQYGVEAGCVNHDVAPRAHDEVRLTGDGINTAPVGGGAQQGTRRAGQTRVVVVVSVGGPQKQHMHDLCPPSC